MKHTYLLGLLVLLITQVGCLGTIEMPNGSDPSAISLSLVSDERGALQMAMCLAAHGQEACSRYPNPRLCNSMEISIRPDARVQAICRLPSAAEIDLDPVIEVPIRCGLDASSRCLSCRDIFGESILNTCRQPPLAFQRITPEIKEMQYTDRVQYNQAQSTTDDAAKECATNNDCLFMFAESPYFPESLRCTGDADCTSRDGVCVDVGAGVGRCFTTPDWIACEHLGMEAVTTRTLSGAEVTVCVGEGAANAFCDEAGTCQMSCQSEYDCQGGGKPYCVYGLCVACQLDEHCSFCQRCQQGVCTFQAAGSDLKDECREGTCLTGSCNGAGACGTVTDGECLQCGPEAIVHSFAEAVNQILINEGLGIVYSPDAGELVATLNGNGSHSHYDYYDEEGYYSNITCDDIAGSMWWGDDTNYCVNEDGEGIECYCSRIGPAATLIACQELSALCPNGSWMGLLQMLSADVATWLEQKADTPDGGFDYCLGSPLVLDLGGDGVKASSLEQGVAFDLTGSGPVHTAWIGGDDALLALDRNGNGRIDDGSELFGEGRDLDNSPGGNGFRSLSLVDSRRHGGNADGKVDSRDTLFAGLRAWTDRNRDGETQPGELKTLNEAQVRQINLTRSYDPWDFDENGNQVGMKGSFMRKDGTRGEMIDVWFAFRSLPSRS